MSKQHKKCPSMEIIFLLYTNILFISLTELSTLYNLKILALLVVPKNSKYLTLIAIPVLPDTKLILCACQGIFHKIEWKPMSA